MRRSKSGYVVGQAMFGKVESDADADSAFASDLKNAIEMQRKGKLLKKTKTDDKLKDLNQADVADAFNMDFDEIKPINRKEQTPDAIVAAKSVDDEDEEKDKKEKKKNKKSGKKEKGKESEHEGLMPDTTTTTPGGPDDDEEHPPPAPAPPSQPAKDLDDYDLL